MFKSFLLLYKGRYIPVGRPRFRKTLTRGWKQKSPEILLPPFIPIHELRIMLRLDYDTCFKACNVAIGQKNYYWKDKEGRQFFTDSKRSVILPYELAAYACKSFGYRPIMVNPEPVWDNIPSRNPIPVAVLIGHSNHGKSTLLDVLSGATYTKIESITQQIRSITIENKLTFIDTPGHELFEILRGRCIHLADIALVVISLEFGGEIQTRDVIIQADMFKVPIIFVLTKSDLPHVDANVTIAELKNQLQNMLHEGSIAKDYAKEASKAVVISSRTGSNIEQLKEIILNKSKEITLPCNPIKPISLGGESVAKYQSFIRKSDSLVGANSTPTSVGLIVDVEKSHGRGLLLNVVVRHGIVVQGNYFVAGTAFGRVKRIYLDSNEVESAHVGHCVQIHGLKPYGNATTDDIFLTLPIDSAFRLSQYRRNVALIKETQKSGRPVDIPFGVDMPIPKEKNAEEITLDDVGDEPIENESILLEPKAEEGSSDAEGRGEGRVYPEEQDVEIDQVPTPKRGEVFGRKSRFLKRDWMNKEEELEEGFDRCDEGAALKSDLDMEQQDEESKSEVHSEEREEFPPKIKSGLEPGQEGRGSPSHFGYRLNLLNRCVLKRWDTRMQQRELELKKQLIDKRSLIIEAEQLRRRVLGEPQMKTHEIEEFLLSGYPDESAVHDKDAVDLEVQKKLVISVIMRTSFVGSLDMLLDGFERIENELQVKIPLVHGGIGPIGPNDVIHAEIENRLSRNVPIYAYQVPVLPDAIKHAIVNKVKIIKFDLFSDLLNHLRSRCINEINRVETLRRKEQY